MSTAKGPQNKTKQAAGCRLQAAAGAARKGARRGWREKLHGVNSGKDSLHRPPTAQEIIPGFHEVRKLLHSEGNNRQAKRQPPEWGKATSTAHLTEADVKDTGITTKTPNPEFSS